MPGSRVAVTQATAAVFVDGRRTGSAVLVTPRHLVTAAHVLRGLDPDTGTEVPMEQVELAFPGPGLGRQDDRLVASRLDLAPAGAGDAAVLLLDEVHIDRLPAPVSLWPAARLPDAVRVFGYPLAEGSLNGVWRQFAVAGPATSGLVQLDWTADVGTFRGHSGGPVIDADGHSVVGILVQGSAPGRFDRYLPVTVIAGVWPELPRPWLFAGGDRVDARSHFDQRAHGQQSVARGGDLFRGREAALCRVRAWLTADVPPGQPMVLTGRPGAGKSAVLARAALSAESEPGGPGLAFHARSAIISDLLSALADLTGVDRPTSVGELVTSLAELPRQPPTRLLVDALDEAASDHDRQEMAKVLSELAVLPGMRVAVATRAIAAANPFAPGQLLRAVGVTTQDDDNLVDLDSDAYFDIDGLRRFAAALLAQDGMDNPGPRDRAWTQYRIQHEMRVRLAGVIAERAGRNFLVAAMAAAPLSIARTTCDPAAKGFDPADIPSGIGEALSKYLERLPEQRRERDRVLLTALAYARGAGLDDPAWLAFAAALGYNATSSDLDVLRHSPAADYLLQTTTTERGGRPVTRLFHQALTDELLAARHQPSDESALLDTLLGQAEHTGWQDRYLCEYAADHASGAGRLDQILEDPLYLINVDPARLVPYLDAAQEATARAAATVYRQSAHRLTSVERPMRASQLELTARQLGWRRLASRIAQAARDRPWQTLWSHGAQAVGHQVLVHGGWVRTVATAALPDGTPVVISGSDDQTVRVWRLEDGAPLGEALRGHNGRVSAVAAAALPDGTPVIISGCDAWGDDNAEDADGRVRVWHLPDGTPTTGSPGGWPAWASSVATAALPDGTPVGISGSRVDWTVRVWRLADGTSIWIRGMRRYDGTVRSVASAALPDGTPVVISGGGYTGIEGVVRIWRLEDGAPVGEPLLGHQGEVTSVASTTLPDGTPVVISGSSDRTVRIWRLEDGAPVGEPLYGHGKVLAIAAWRLSEGNPVVISGNLDGTVRVWRLGNRPLVRQPRHGHDGHVTSVALTALPDGTPVVISGSDDQTVRIWRLEDGAPVGEPLLGHQGKLTSVASAALPDGTPVVISGSSDRTVRIWRLEDGTAIGEPLYHQDEVIAVSVGELPDGTPFIVSGSLDQTVRIWRLEDGAPVGEPLHADREVWGLAAGSLPDGTPTIVSAGGIAGTLRIWRLTDSALIWEVVRDHDVSASSVAIRVLPDGTAAIISNGGFTVRTWRLDDGAPFGEPRRSHGLAFAISAEVMPTDTLIIDGGHDGALRAWQLAGGMELVPPLYLSEPVKAVAAHGKIIISAAGADIAVHQLTPVCARVDS